MSMRNLVTCLAVSALCLTLAPRKPALAAPVAPAGVERVLVKMIEAVKAQSYDDFLTDADDHLKTNLSRQQFEAFAACTLRPCARAIGSNTSASFGSRERTCTFGRSPSLAGKTKPYSGW